jgi:predicted acetyltransferase
VSEIRKLNEEELTNYLEIVLNAYPSMKASAEVKEETLRRFIDRQSNDESLDYLGLYRNNKLLGGMRVHSYHMNLFSKIIPVGGVGLVAVDLLHKKEKAAKELIESFMKIFLGKGVNMVLLYPFRPDFYKKMGFGYGPKMHQYRIRPESFPKGPSKSNLRFLSSEDKEKAAECYTKIVKRTNGMFLKTAAEIEGWFSNPENRMIGFDDGAEIKGYLLFTFEKRSQTHFMFNDLVIKEFMYDSPEALLEITTFLHSQADQVDRIVWNTQEENVHFLIDDPRNGSGNLLPSVYHESNISGIGLMYRIIDTKGIFEDLKERNFNHINAKVNVQLIDTMLSHNNGELILHSSDGRVRVVENGEYDVEISLDISDFSSLLMGVVTFKELYLFGKAKLSNPSYINTINTLFSTTEKPRCITAF